MDLDNAPCNLLVGLLIGLLLGVCITIARFEDDLRTLERDKGKIEILERQLTEYKLAEGW